MRHLREWTLGLATLGVVGCRPGDVLSVPPPAAVLGSSTLQNQNGATGAFNAAKAQLFSAADGGYSGLLTWSELLTDEFTFSGFQQTSVFANIDARTTTGGGGFFEQEDFAWQRLLQARSRLLAVVPGLTQYEPANQQSTVGEAYALAGYAELLLAEAYCAGTPLSEVAPGGNIQYGRPLTTDSLLGVAEAHFDSARAKANGDATVTALGGVGLGRALLDRGQFAAAAAAVQGVPTSFVYNVELEPSFSSGAAQLPNIYALGVQISYYAMFTGADQEGQTGLNFVSAHDPRLVIDSTSYNTADGTVPWRVPTKFEANLSLIPLATGIEARLIEAEAALQANNPAGWLADLNTLRNSGCRTPGVDSTCALGTGQVPTQATGIASLADPGSDSGRVSATFRERAFWLFGTGSRVGDLRRLIRQYGRDQSTVFPSGPYANGNDSHLPAPIASYGADVSLTLPTPYGLSSNGISETNPNYRGCIASTKTA